jgi:hypothetical protein
MTQHERAGTLAGPPPVQLPTKKSATNLTDDDDGNWERIYDYSTSSFLFVNQKTGRIRQTPLVPAKKRRKVTPTPPSPLSPRPDAIVSSGPPTFVMTPRRLDGGGTQHQPIELDLGSDSDRSNGTQPPGPPAARATRTRLADVLADDDSSQSSGIPESPFKKRATVPAALKDDRTYEPVPQTQLDEPPLTQMETHGFDASAGFDYGG